MRWELGESILKPILALEISITVAVLFLAADLAADVSKDLLACPWLALYG